MSLDVTLNAMRNVAVYEGNITHNLIPMAKALGIDKYLWRPEERNISIAKELIYPLSDALVYMIKNRQELLKYEPENGFGTYEGLKDFISEYLEACVTNPDAIIEIWK